jgi:hypothetical protein
MSTNTGTGHEEQGYRGFKRRREFLYGFKFETTSPGYFLERALGPATVVSPF